MKLFRRPDHVPGAALLKLENIDYGVGHTHALRNAHLEIGHSEFHVVVGDHGAGKTTLANLTAGLIRPDSGLREFNGRPLPHLTQQGAARLKIELVCQEIYLIPCLSVMENLLIPDLISYWPPFFRRRNYHQEACDMMRNFGFDYDPGILVQELRPADQLIVYILRSVLRNPLLLILDAVLEKLPSKHLEKVLHMLSIIKKEGTSILCLAHGVDEVFSIADKVTILRNGKTILTESIENVDKINLIKLCYSQFTDNSKHDDHREFYQLLRYNEAILQKLPINLVVMDSEDRIKMINNHGLRYFHMDDVDYRKLFVDDLFQSGDGKALALIKSAIEEKKEKVFFAVPIEVGGLKTTANIKVLPIEDGAFIIGNILIVEDISKQEALRQQLTMTEKLASVGILSAGVAHEINNPLEIVYNHLNYLKFNLSKSQVHETIESIEEELEDIKQIVSNLITFSDRSRVVIEPLDLCELIQSIICLIKIEAGRRNIEIEYTPSSLPVMVEAKRNEIKQVILNLFKNSFEAMGDTGRIVINTGLEQTGGISMATICFRDNGCGINDEDPSNIFLPFYSSKLGKEANLGLGLSVSYGIVSKYNGLFKVRNLDDGGCEFTILLPAVHEDPPMAS